MPKPKRGKKEGEKYVPVPVNPLPAPTADAEEHLRAFIAAFIQAPPRYRWEHCLIEAPEKAQERLGHFHIDLDPAHYRYLRGAERFPLQLASVYGNPIGVFFDGKPARLVTAAEAATLATDDFSNALLSLVPGKRVLCFDHEGGVWACER